MAYVSNDHKNLNSPEGKILKRLWLSKLWGIPSVCSTEANFYPSKIKNGVVEKLDSDSSILSVESKK